MKLVVIFLNKVECLEDILSGFLEIGAPGATVINSVGMGHILSHDVPIFAGLASAFPGTHPGNKTIMLVARDALVEDIIAVLEDVCGSFDDPGNGVAVTIQLDSVHGVPSDGR